MRVSEALQRLNPLARVLSALQGVRFGLRSRRARYGAPCATSRCLLHVLHRTKRLLDTPVLATGAQCLRVGASRQQLLLDFHRIPGGARVVHSYRLMPRTMN